jgi:hypothetical protein
MTAPTGPVMGFRRWRVTDDGKLMGLGLAEVWESARQTAECKGQKPVKVAEYCDPPETHPLDSVRAYVRRYLNMPYEWGGASTRAAYPLPDGRWVRLVDRFTCQHDVEPDHVVPSLKSLCGIWAHKAPVPDCACPEPGADRHGAVGVVRMWGRAVEHKDGWRSEHAELVAVVDHSGRLRDYGVPRYATTQAMYAEWAPDAQGWAARHDQVWCGYVGSRSWLYGPGMNGQAWSMAAGSVVSSQPVLTSQQMRQYLDQVSKSLGTTVPAMATLGRAMQGASASFSVLDETHADDPKAKALRDRQTRNANHPGQDRPEQSRRKRRHR